MTGTGPFTFVFSRSTTVTDSITLSKPHTSYSTRHRFESGSASAASNTPLPFACFPMVVSQPRKHW